MLGATMIALESMLLLVPAPSKSKRWARASLRLDRISAGVTRSDRLLITPDSSEYLRCSPMSMVYRFVVPNQHVVEHGGADLLFGPTESR